MSVTTLSSDTRTTVPAPRRTPRHHAAVAAIDAALGEFGCILVSTTTSADGCVVAFYDARSLGRAVDVISSAALRGGDQDLADRARQTGPGAWRVTARPQAWTGPDGDPGAAGNRSSTTWALDIPLADVVPTAAALLT